MHFIHFCGFYCYSFASDIKYLIGFTSLLRYRTIASNRLSTFICIQHIWTSFIRTTSMSNTHTHKYIRAHDWRFTACVNCYKCDIYVRSEERKKEKTPNWQNVFFYSVNHRKVFVINVKWHQCFLIKNFFFFKRKKNRVLVIHTQTTIAIVPLSEISFFSFSIANFIVSVFTVFIDCRKYYVI